MSISPESRLQTLGLILPPPPEAGGIYHPVVLAGGLAYVSGQAPVRSDGSLITGTVGEDLDVAAGQAAARQAGLTLLATLRMALGSLDRVHRLVKTLGMVNCLPGFAAQPQVIDGFSALMVAIWGETNGRGARSAVGMTLPGHIAVEIEAIFELHPESEPQDLNRAG